MNIIKEELVQLALKARADNKDYREYTAKEVAGYNILMKTRWTQVFKHNSFWEEVREYMRKAEVEG